MLASSAINAAQVKTETQRVAALTAAPAVESWFKTAGSSQDQIGEALIKPVSGGAKKIVQLMEDSLNVPTATSDSG